MSQASDCMAYVYASRKKFEMLIEAQKHDPAEKTVRPRTKEEDAAIKEARKKGLSWREIAQTFHRAPATVRAIYLSK